jgi:hypothetical protein
MCGKFAPFFFPYFSLFAACRRTINLFNLIIRCFAFSMKRRMEERKNFYFLACFSLSLFLSRSYAAARSRLR